MSDVKEIQVPEYSNGSMMIYESEGGDVRLDVRLENGTVWLTQQHISVLLGGKVNMTLETLAKLEEALSLDLIGQSLKGYLNDSGVHGPAHEGVNTSDLVDGYKPRKKKGPKGIK